MRTRRQGSLPGPLYTEKRQRQEGHGIGGGVLEPCQGAAEPEGDSAGRGCRPAEVEPPEKEVRGTAGHQLEQHVEEDESEAVLEEQDGREEGRRLHLAGQRRTQSFVGVPPWNVSVEPIRGDQMSHGLGDVTGVGVDDGVTGKKLMNRPGLYAGE